MYTSTGESKQTIAVLFCSTQILKNEQLIRRLCQNKLESNHAAKAMCNRIMMLAETEVLAASTVKARQTL